MLKLVAVLVTISRARALTVRVEMVGKLGGTFTSLTMTVKVLVALRGGVPPSVTTTWIVLVEGLLVWAGVQVITAALVLRGVRVMPSGADAKLKVKACAGTSGSVAVLVSVRVVNSSTTRFVRGALVG